MSVALDLKREAPIAVPQPEESASGTQPRPRALGSGLLDITSEPGVEPAEVGDPSGFSPSYTAARARFRAAARAVRASVSTQPIEAHGPRGEELAIDFARVGPRDASRLVVVSSGTHGIEGFLGSAVQARFLEGLASGRRSLPAGVAMLFVHAVNPYGFAWHRRVNEDNIDLNRNFVPAHERYEGKPPKFDEVVKVLDRSRAPGRFERLPLLRVGGTILRHGFGALKQALVAGQYDYPDTLFFGGRGPSESMKILSRVLPALAGRPERITHLDVHSGLGPRGHYSLLLDQKYSEGELARLRRFFPDSRLEVVAGDDVEVGYSIRGGFLAWCATSLFADTDYQTITAECGTQPNLRVLEALYLEHLAHYHGRPETSAYRRAKERLLEAFAPSDPDWRHGAAGRGVRLVDQAVQMASE